MMNETGYRQARGVLRGATDRPVEERVRTIRGEDVPPLEEVLPEDWDADVRYEGEGPSTLIGGGEGKYRAFVGPWNAHASGRFEGYGETRDAAIRAAVANAQEAT